MMMLYVGTLLFINNVWKGVLLLEILNPTNLTPVLNFIGVVRL